MIVSYNNVFQIVVTQFSDIVTDIIEMDTNSIRIILRHFQNIITKSMNQMLLKVTFQMIQ